jgi:UDP-2,4-diacetamido-2,4,6-trideoxy-beta-L-altropyranose hydrolase
MKVVFITDGGLEVGMGHVQQSTTLARELRDKAEICFLTKSDEIVVNQIKDAGFDAFRLNNDNGIAGLLQEIKPNIVIFDKIDVDEDFARQLKDSLKAKLVIFTNLTSGNKYADIAVTADIGSQFRNIRFLDEKTNTLYFYGPKYWVLRKEFYEFKKKGKTLRDKVEKIVLIFGGSDASNLTSTALNELLCLGSDLKIDVILGAQFVYLDELNQVMTKYRDTKENISIYRNTKNVAELMYKADLVIASPGLSVFEALCVGTPVIVMPQNQLQKDTYQGFMRILDKNEVNKLKDVIVNRDFTYADEAHIIKMEIGEGKAELIEEILK